MDAYSVLEDYTFKLHIRYAPPLHPATTLAPPLNLYEQLSTTPPAFPTQKDASAEIETLNEAQLQDLRFMSNQMDILADYRRNNWMCVAVSFCCFKQIISAFRLCASLFVRHPSSSLFCQ